MNSFRPIMNTEKAIFFTWPIGALPISSISCLIPSLIGMEGRPELRDGPELEGGEDQVPKSPNWRCHSHNVPSTTSSPTVWGMIAPLPTSSCHL